MVENMKSQGSRQDESLKREGKERRKSVRVCLAALLTRSVTRRWSCDSNSYLYLSLLFLKRS